MEQTSWIKSSDSQKVAVVSRWDALVITSSAGAKQGYMDMDQSENLALHGKKLPSRMAVAGVTRAGCPWAQQKSLRG